MSLEYEPASEPLHISERSTPKQVVLGRAANKGFMDLVDPFGLASPWVR